MEAGWMEDYLDLLTWSYQTMFIWGTFYDSLVSINSYEIGVDRDPLVCAEMTGIKQVTCNITRGGGGRKVEKGLFPTKSP